MKNKNISNISCGLLYFYIHFITEIVCFFFLGVITKWNIFVWLIPLLYDGLAFVPQSLIGVLKDKYEKLNVSLIGTILLFIGILIYLLFSSTIISLIFVCLGNAFIHIGGAYATINTSKGKLSSSAIFVAGGSFGLITGKLIADILPMWILLPLIVTMIPFILLADTYKKESIKEFNYANEKLNPLLVIFLVVFVVTVRGYMGYGIPTSWNKTVIQTILLYVFMGTGKAMGGILSDTIGLKKTALISTIGALPFLCFGDNIMIVSLIGVMLFSMSMSITLALLVSIFKGHSGLAFGLTTIGLFLGTAPIFYFKITSSLVNYIMLIVLSLLCAFILNLVIKKGH